MSKGFKSPIPQGNYVPATRYGQTIYTAGMTPRENGELIMVGKVLREEELQKYQPAVTMAAKNALIAAMNLLEPCEEIDKVLLMTVYICAEDGFEKHAKIADFASDFLYQEIGDCAIGSRVAIGVASLPGNAPLEIQLTVSAKQKKSDGHCCAF
ncbi:MAG: RidA family protein [Clostridia bacterium]|nr:RidA family protein [Clostridia bacterium]